MSTLTQSAPSTRRAFVGSAQGVRIIRTPSDLAAYLSGKPTLSAAQTCAMARVEAVLRMAVTGR